MRPEPLHPQQDLELARHLLDLQHRSYAIEAQLIDDTRIPTLHETVADLQAAALSWLGVRDRHGVVVGAVGFRETPDLVDIDRLVVDPSHLRQGLGRAVVEAVLELAARRTVIVSTGRENRPARRLYEQLLFSHVSDEEVLPGLWVSRYTRTSEP